ncbi:GTP-binding protein [Brachybacterium aquaticum]|uniref:CobW C-terminal domain-containing protein n=1 Tax=Brachybacterium aquaticum TaxID=1432564 RepID=A0A841AH23_9MICO|nr:GTP-binding protein [Brachybacterium aquaticum]MBB5832590.1 hypothetical protein [Brachybacterium aquaticum]
MLDQVLRDALLASLLLDGQGFLALRYEVTEDSSALRRLAVAADGVHEDELVDLARLARLARLPEVTGILLAPPLSADPSIVAGTLRPHEDAWHLASAIALAALREYSDLLVLSGDADGAGAELVERLRAPEQRLLHDPFAATVQYVLGGGRLRGRGRFWVPERPDSICQWDGAGGQVSIGAVWRTDSELPTTRLVITGQDPEGLPRVRNAFARSLLTPQEWA